MDRHILKAMYGRLNSPPPERKAKPSCLGALREEAANLLSDLAVPVMAAYWYLKNEGKTSCSYSNFKALRPEKRAGARRLRRHPHPLYETGPGEQMQCDWVEGLSIVFRDGTEFAFNLFSTTLVFSRLHYFELAEPAAEPLGVSKEKKDE